jgi:hypothetical protein
MPFVHGWWWEWARRVQEIVLAMDVDLAGLQGWHGDGWGPGILRRKRVAFLPPEAYGGHFG